MPAKKKKDERETVPEVEHEEQADFDSPPMSLGAEAYTVVEAAPGGDDQ